MKKKPIAYFPTPSATKKNPFLPTPLSLSPFFFFFSKIDVGKKIIPPRKNISVRDEICHLAHFSHLPCLSVRPLVVGGVGREGERGGENKSMSTLFQGRL